MKISSVVLAAVLGIAPEEAKVFEGVQVHSDGRISFRRQLSEFVWEFHVLPPK